MPNPLVSIVVPTFNCEGLIEDCLKSVKNQSYPHIEIIMVDSFSSDRTPVISEKYGRVYSFGRDPNQKSVFAVPFQRNFGAQKAAGKYVFYMDSDMRLTEKLIERCVELAEKEGADAVIIPEVSYGEGFWSHCRALEKKCYNMNTLSCTDASRFVKKSVWDQLGGLDVALGGGDDFDFQLRLNDAGYKILKSDLHLNHYEGRLTLGRQIRKKFIYGKQALFFYKKHRKRKGYLIKQCSIIRPDFLKGYRLLLRDPIHACGMVLMKIIENAAGWCGLVYSGIFREEIVIRG